MSNICSEKMIIYSIIGKVNNELDKLYYWKSFQKVFDSVDPIIVKLNYKMVDSYQLWQKFLKQTKDGYYRMTGRKASTGGRMIWSKKNCEKICTKYLTDNEHLIFAFEHSYKEMLGKYYEKGKEILDIRNHEILGKIDKQNNRYLDFVIRIYPTSNNGNWNQAINVFLSSRLIEYVSNIKVEKMVYELAKTANSVKIGKTYRDWDHLLEMKGDVPTIDNIMWRSYLVDDELNFTENKFGNWEEINYTQHCSKAKPNFSSKIRQQISISPHKESPF